ncbi:MAG: hypothetical protein Q8S13_08385, partial [Dehalococcoidia bacterium]|nr:hypothetical protein [Dehalococcoidia bacterium]
SGITPIDTVVDQVLNFVSSKFVVLAAALGFIGGLISFVAGGEWSVALQGTFRFAFVAALVIGLGNVIDFFAGAGAVLG